MRLERVRSRRTVAGGTDGDGVMRGRRTEVESGFVLVDDFGVRVRTPEGELVLLGGVTVRDEDLEADEASAAGSAGG